MNKQEAIEELKKEKRITELIGNFAKLPKSEVTTEHYDIAIEAIEKQIKGSE